MGCSVPWKGIPDFSWKSLHFLSDLKETPSDTFRRTMENRSNYTYRYRAPLPERESGAFCHWTKRATTRKKKRKKGRKGGEEEEEGRSRKIPVALSSGFFRVVRPRKPGYRLILLIVLPRTRPRISWTGKFVYTVAQKYPDTCFFSTRCAWIEDQRWKTRLCYGRVIFILTSCVMNSASKLFWHSPVELNTPFSNTLEYLIPATRININ